MMTAAKRYCKRKKTSSATLYPDRRPISGRCGIYLRIVLGIASVQRDRLQIQAAVKVDGGHDVSLMKRKKIQPF